MYEDEPQDRVHDVLAEAIFGDHPLGRRVLGQRRGDRLDPGPRHRRLPRRPLHRREHRRRRRRATSITRDRRARRARRSSSPPPAASRGRRRSRRPTARGRACCFYEKETEQYHICFGGPGISRDDERRFALAVLDAIFGGSSSSRLFREVREKRGLAYSVGSYTEQYTDPAWSRSTSAPARTTSRRPARSSAASSARLRTRASTDEELDRAKEHVKGRMVLGLESTAARMTPARPLDAVRHAAAVARRDARARSTRSPPTRSPSSPPSSTAPSGSRPPASGRDEDRFRRRRRR